jgi:hypothetical protein
MTRLALAVVVMLVSARAGAETPLPTPIGVGPQFHPSAENPAVERGLAIGRLRCGADGQRLGVHLELFARGRVVIVPAGIGVAPPVRREGVHVRSGRCSYPVRTHEPTGVIELRGSERLTLGDFFAVWGRQVSPRRLLGFDAAPDESVRAYVNGRRLRGDPRSIALRAHDELVLEVGTFVPPHASYRFPKGL